MDTAQTTPGTPTAEPRHRHVTIRDGVRLHLTEYGHGAPVLLLHGFPQHGNAWRRLAPHLAAGHRLICVDQRGFGRSDAPARGYGTDNRVADALALLDALGLDRVPLISHDWGAWTGFQLCLRAPERITHHLALNMTHPWPRHRHLAPQSWRFWYTALLEQPLLGRWMLRRRPGFTRFLLRRGVADPAVWTAAALEETVRASRRPGSARAGEALHRAFVFQDLPRLVLGRYRGLRLTVPTVLLAGERDFLLPPSVLADPGGRAADLRVRVVPGCGHYLHEERPELVAETARRLFAEDPGRTPGAP